MAAGLGIGWGINWGSITLAANAVLDYLTFKLNFNTIATDFTFTRNSFATRVNEFGLIETVTDLGSDLIQNGSFDELGSELVSNGDFENGSTDWSLDSGWSIADGIGSCDGTSGASIYQNVGGVLDTTYKIEVTISNYISGTLQIGGSSANLEASANGTFTHYRTWTSDSTLYLKSKSGDGFNGSIDNVSVKQVDPNDDWEQFGLGITITDKANFDGSGATVNFRQLGIITTSKTYKVTYTVSDLSQGYLRMRVGGAYGAIRTVNGTYTDTLTATNNNFQIYGFSNFIGSIDNISAQEVLEDDVPRIDYTGSTFDVPVLSSELVTNGTFDTNINGWVKGSGTTNPISWDSGKMKVTNDVALLNSARQSITTVIGKTYLVTADVDSTNGVNPRLATSNPTTAIIGTGGTIETLSYTFVATSTFSEINLYNWQNTLGAYNLWDNVSVKEVTAYTTTDKGAFLLEPISTNFIDYSEDFTDVYWIKSTSGSGIAPIVTTNYAVSPDGTQNADRIQFDATTSGSNADRSRIRTTLSLTDTSDYTFSFYAKSTDGTDQKIGVLFDNSQISTFTITDEWQRFEATATQFGTSSICGLDLRSGIAFTSDILVYGIQIEELSYATSYIPTNGTTVTRAQESCIDATPTINSEEGVLYAEISALADTGTRRCISLSNGSTSNRVMLRYDSVSNRIQCFAQIGGTVYADISTTSYDTTDVNKIAYRYKSGEYALYINGVEQGTSTDATIFPQDTLTELSFRRGDNNANQDFYGRTKDLKIYDKALTDEELTELTTI